MKDLEVSVIKQNYSLIKIEQLLIQINSNLEKNGEYEFADLLSPTISQINDTIYEEISNNLNITYSGDRYVYLILYSILKKLHVSDLDEKTRRLMSFY